LPRLCKINMQLSTSQEIGAPRPAFEVTRRSPRNFLSRRTPEIWDRPSHGTLVVSSVVWAERVPNASWTRSVVPSSIPSTGQTPKDVVVSARRPHVESPSFVVYNHCGILKVYRGYQPITAKDFYVHTQPRANAYVMVVRLYTRHTRNTTTNLRSGFLMVITYNLQFFYFIDLRVIGIRRREYEPAKSCFFSYFFLFYDDLYKRVHE